MYAEIRGQDAAVKRLQAAVRTGRIAPAYLFTGPAGVGKYMTAQAFAGALLCAAPVDGAACGECRFCRLFSRSGHPDFHAVAAGEATIGVDQIRHLVAAVGRKPFHRRHVVAIDAAERATLEAQNAFLKTLEEAPGEVVFILVTAYPEALLPTVVSRCREVRFRQLSPAVVAGLLEARGVPAAEAGLLARLSGGSLGRALRLKGDPQMWSLRVKALELALRPGLWGTLQVSVRSRKEAEELLCFLSLWYRDLLLFRVTGDAALVVNIDRLAEIEKTRVPVAALLAAAEALEVAKRMLRANVNPRLVVEGIAVRLGAVFRAR
ncbi:DNA polymerase III subunit delta' [Thermodesulfitimonas sp.]